MILCIFIETKGSILGTTKVVQKHEMKFNKIKNQLGKPDSDRFQIYSTLGRMWSFSINSYILWKFRKDFPQLSNNFENRWVYYYNFEP